jgi:hypothetical protein
MTFREIAHCASIFRNGQTEAARSLRTDCLRADSQPRGYQMLSSGPDHVNTTFNNKYIIFNFNLPFRVTLTD